MNKTIKIGNGQGFWGDSIDAPIKLAQHGEINYLTLDYLAEVTMSIMQKQKLKNPLKGYAQDFIELIKKILPQIKKYNLKIITNAGGANPIACREELIKILGGDIKIAVIEGDDIFNDLDFLHSNGASFENMESGEKFVNIKKHVTSANAYINSFSIAEALKADAQIVLAGRVSDPGLALGPCIYEFDWKENEYDKLASGTLAGHITECGAQCTGGNFSKWRDVPNLANIGYPIIEIDNTGDFYVTKAENTGGLVNKDTISEQILYEMGDPKNYISPDVCVDFTSFNLEETAPDRVKISNVKGHKPTDTYKVSISYFAGYKAHGQLTISGPDAFEKAKLTSSIIWERLSNAGYDYNDKLTEYLGLSSCHGDINEMPSQLNEVVLRLSVRDISKEKVNRFGKEIAPVITTGPPGVTGFSGGRPKAQEIIAYWPTLISKKLISTKITIIS